MAKTQRTTTASGMRVTILSEIKFDPKHHMHYMVVEGGSHKKLYAISNTPTGPFTLATKAITNQMGLEPLDA